MAGTWRYLAERVTGEGHGEPIASDMLLNNVSITEKLSGPNQITCDVPVEVSQLRGDDGRPLFEEWGTAIYAEDENRKLYGGILIDSKFNGPNWQMDCAGFGLYPKGQPYTESRYWIDVDPLSMHRHIWEHLQSLPGGNLAVEVEHVDSPVRVGKQIENVEFQTAEGQMVAFEAGPFKLNYFTNNDMGKIIDDLAKETPFDWREEHYWDGDIIRHRIRVGYPRIGRRRTDLKLAIGENVRVIPTVSRAGEGYASDVLFLGEGEGRDKVAGSVGKREPRRLRRVAVLDDSSLRSKGAAIDAARAELARRNGAASVSDIELTEHVNAPLAKIELGDEVYLEGWTGWVELANWVRIVSKTTSPAKSDSIRLTVIPAETGAA